MHVTWWERFRVPRAGDQDSLKASRPSHLLEATTIRCPFLSIEARLQAGRLITIILHLQREKAGFAAAPFCLPAAGMGERLFQPVTDALSSRNQGGRVPARGRVEAGRVILAVA